MKVVTYVIEDESNYLLISLSENKNKKYWLKIYKHTLKIDLKRKFYFIVINWFLKRIN